jgi:breast cancer 2 susceptibility protein
MTEYDVGGSDDFDMDDDLFLGEPLPPLISRSLDISEQPTNGSKVTDPVSFVTTSTGLPGWTSASSRSGGALVPSAASLANAQKMLAGWNDDPDDDGDASLSAADTNFVGFSSASNKSIMPSAAALASAERKRKQWESDLLSCSDQEEEEGVEPPHSSLAADGEKSEMPSTTSFVGGNACTVIPSTPFKTPFKAPIIPHHAVPPVTAAPSGSMMSPFKSTASSSSLPFTPLADRVLSNSPALVFQGGKSRAFKSPLLLTTLNKASASPVPARSVYRPPNNSQSGHRPSQASMLASLRTDNAPLSTPERPSFPGSIHATSSQKPAHSKSMSSQRAPSFSTPFKNGMRPGEPGRVRLEEERDRSRQAARTHPASNLVSDMTFSTKGTTREDYRFFNLRT